MAGLPDTHQPREDRVKGNSQARFGSRVGMATPRLRQPGGGTAVVCRSVAKS